MTQKKKYSKEDFEWQLLFAEVWPKIVARTWTDEVFKKRLIKNPREALGEYGVFIPTEIKLEINGSHGNQINLTLPDKPDEDLSEVELKLVSGGLCTCTASCCCK